MSHFRQRLLLFKNPGFSWYFLSCCTATIGGGMGYIAMTWLALQAKNSVGTVAMIMLCFWLPGILLGPLMGALTDFFPKRHYLMALSTSIRAIALFAFAYQLSQHNSLSGIYLLALIQGTFFSIFIPASTRFTREIIPENQLLAANATLNMAFELGCVIGMGLVGLVIHWLSAPAALLLNGLLFVISSASLLMISSKALNVTHHHKLKFEFINDFKESIQYLRSKKGLIMLYTFQLLIFVQYMIAPVLLAPFAKNVLHANAGQFGYLESSLSIGIILGGFLMPWLADKLGMRKLIIITCLILGVSYLLFSHNTQLLLSEFLYFVIGLGYSIWAVLITKAQLQTDVQFQGRLQSVFNSISGVIILAIYLAIRTESQEIAIQSFYWLMAFISVVMIALSLWRMKNKVAICTQQ